jgi:hypothetical protein
MRRLLVCGVIGSVLVAPLPVTARSDKDGHYQVLGTGTASCGTWTSDMKQGGVLAAGDKEWLLGFLTAYNLHGPGTNNISKGTDAGGLFAYVDNYCAAHPLEVIADAAQQLQIELSKRSAP